MYVQLCNQEYSNCTKSTNGPTLNCCAELHSKLDQLMCTVVRTSNFQSPTSKKNKKKEEMRMRACNR